MKKEIKTIIWIDAAGCKNDGTEWYNKEEALALAKEKFEAKAFTGGVILESNKDYIVVASTKSDDQYSDITMIPKKMVIKIF